MTSNTVKDIALANSDRKNSSYVYPRKLNSVRVWFWLGSQLAQYGYTRISKLSLTLQNRVAKSKLPTGDGPHTALVTSQTEPRDGLEYYLA